MRTWSGNASRKARRRRPRRRPLPARRSRAQLIVPLAVPMALGLALGVVAATSGGPARITISRAGANMDCQLIVPANPLSAAGLATPYQLTGPGGQDPAASGCTQANPNLQAFVQATILNPATGRLWVYEPLVVTLSLGSWSTSWKLRVVGHGWPVCGDRPVVGMRSLPTAMSWSAAA